MGPGHQEASTPCLPRTTVLLRKNGYKKPQARDFLLIVVINGSKIVIGHMTKSSQA